MVGKEGWRDGGERRDGGDGRKGRWVSGEVGGGGGGGGGGSMVVFISYSSIAVAATGSLT